MVLGRRWFFFLVSRKERSKVGGFVNKFIIVRGRKENELLICFLLFLSIF